ncbi:hypothetical protein [Pseudoalteromonas rubra]|uniref:hypothetical protein n=1 Tax=Pseudoalteromonas rubra TaxID=43658 RepID=UPI002DB76EFD|nr:hypothetical protein [Pseudoalteromonas rubra]MEC4088755.1 hypothetical protein [Pseudoalteromonas rubra]
MSIITALAGFGRVTPSITHSFDGLYHLGKAVLTNSRVIKIGGKVIDFANVAAATTDAITVANEISRAAMGDSYLNLKDDLTDYSVASIQAIKDNNAIMQQCATINLISSGLDTVDSKLTLFNADMVAMTKFYQQISTIEQDIAADIPVRFTWLSKGANGAPISSYTGLSTEHQPIDYLTLGLAGGSLLWTIGVFSYKGYQARLKKKTGFYNVELASQLHGEIAGHVEQPSLSYTQKLAKKLPEAVVKKGRYVAKMVKFVTHTASVASAVFGLKEFITGIQDTEKVKKTLREATHHLKEASKYIKLIKDGVPDKDLQSVATYFSMKIDGDSEEAQSNRALLQSGLDNATADIEDALAAILGGTHASGSTQYADLHQSNIDHVYQLLLSDFNKFEQDHMTFSAKDTEILNALKAEYEHFKSYRDKALDKNLSPTLRDGALRDIGMLFTARVTAGIFIDAKHSVDQLTLDAKVLQSITHETKRLLTEWLQTKAYFDSNFDHLVDVKLAPIKLLSPDVYHSLLESYKVKLHDEIDVIKAAYETTDVNGKAANPPQSVFDEVWRHINGYPDWKTRQHWKTKDDLNELVKNIWRAIDKTSISAVVPDDERTLIANKATNLITQYQPH